MHPFMHLSIHSWIYKPVYIYLSSHYLIIHFQTLHSKKSLYRYCHVIHSIPLYETYPPIDSLWR